MRQTVFPVWPASCRSLTRSVNTTDGPYRSVLDLASCVPSAGGCLSITRRTHRCVRLHLRQNLFVPRGHFCLESYGPLGRDTISLAGAGGRRVRFHQSESATAVAM